MHTGSCFCGAVQFRITGELNPIQICHCGQCRKAQGGAFASNIAVDTEHFAITAGDNVISRMDALPDVVRVRVGTINEPLIQTVAHHQFVAYKADWYEIKDDAPQYDEYPPSPDYS